VQDAGPWLQNEPDGRKADGPLFDAVAPVIVAIVAGAPAATACVLWNLAGVRRWPAIASALALGLVGSVAATGTLLFVAQAGMDPQIPTLAARVVALATGGALYLLHRTYVRGHLLMGGAVLPTYRVFLVAIVFTFVARDWAERVAHPWLALIGVEAP
jgi:hypothetical protein